MPAAALPCGFPLTYQYVCYIRKRMSKRGRGSLREKSKSQTRQAIVEAAVACFSEAGLDSPSLDSICARAGCTRGAFYVHFKNRDALIAAAMAERRGAVLSTML